MDRFTVIYLGLIALGVALGVALVVGATCYQLKLEDECKARGGVLLKTYAGTSRVCAKIEVIPMN